MAKSRKIVGFACGVFLISLLLLGGIIGRKNMMGPGTGATQNWYPVPIEQAFSLQHLADSLESNAAFRRPGIAIQIVFQHYRTHPLRDSEGEHSKALDALIGACKAREIPYSFEVAIRPPEGLKPSHIRPGYLLTSLAGLLIKNTDYPPIGLKFGAQWFSSEQICEQVQTFARESRQIPALATIHITDQTGMSLHSP